MIDVRDDAKVPDPSRIGRGVTRGHVPSWHERDRDCRLAVLEGGQIAIEDWAGAALGW
jgi:hypothetical protein